MKKYYEEAKYKAAYNRCVDVMTQLLQKYGHQVLDKLEQDAPQTADCSKDDKQAQPFTDEPHPVKRTVKKYKVFPVSSRALLAAFYAAR